MLDALCFFTFYWGFRHFLKRAEICINNLHRVPIIIMGVQKITVAGGGGGIILVQHVQCFDSTVHTRQSMLLFWLERKCA